MRSPMAGPFSGALEWARTGAGWRRMSRQRLERANERDRRQGAVLDVLQERAVALQLRLLRGVLHDAQVAGERIADAAIEVEQQRHAVDRMGEHGRVGAAIAAVIF